MSSSDLRREAQGVFVSLQAANHDGDLVGGHVAAGILVDQDLVLIPDLPRKMIGEVGRCDIVLVPLPTPDAGKPERLKPSGLEAHALNDAGDHASVVVRLAQPTALPPLTGLHFPPGKQLTAKLRKNGGRVSEVLQHGGAEVGVLGLDPTSVLSQLDRVETSSSPAVKLVTYRSPQDFAWSLCRWIRCEPDPRPPAKPRTGDVTWVKLRSVDRPIPPA